MHTLIFATSNPNKVKEIKAFFADMDVSIQSLLDYPDIPEAPEPYETFHENALGKASFLQQYMSGIIISDDSGLEVEHLNGRPGVHSKRYSPEGTAETNNSLLLHEMSGVANRSARFICVMAILNESEHHFIEGICSGTIDTQLRGTEGFGYDPLFLPDAYPGRSMAEISMTEKNAISHRGRALQGVKTWLRTLNSTD